MFPLVSEAAAKVIPLESLRWITFGHVESDECGSMNEWLAAAERRDRPRRHRLPRLDQRHGRPPTPTACRRRGDGSRRQARATSTRRTSRTTGKRGFSTRDDEHAAVRGHWRRLHTGDGPAITQDDVGPAMEGEEMFLAAGPTPALAPTIRKLADLQPATLAIMHGSSFSGDCAATLTRSPITTRAGSPTPSSRARQGSVTRSGVTLASDVRPPPPTPARRRPVGTGDSALRSCAFLLRRLI